jgi:hypothetical protein
VGTSSARKAPVGKFWRTAKTYASRFASGKEASPPQAKEVVARYLAALQADGDGDNQGDQNFLPFLAGAAASLDSFYRQWEQDGWEAALANLRLPPRQAQNRENIIPALLDRLIGPGNKLAEAVARAALIDHLEVVLSACDNFPPKQQPSDLTSNNKISHFLGLALYRKILSDLGESLEFHAPDLKLGRRRQEDLRSHILAKIPAWEPAEVRDVPFSSEPAGAVLDRILSLLGGRDER